MLRPAGPGGEGGRRARLAIARTIAFAVTVAAGCGPPTPPGPLASTRTETDGGTREPSETGATPDAAAIPKATATTPSTTRDAGTSGPRCGHAIEARVTSAQTRPVSYTDCRLDLEWRCKEARKTTRYNVICACPEALCSCFADDVLTGTFRAPARCETIQQITTCVSPVASDRCGFPQPRPD